VANNSNPLRLFWPEIDDAPSAKSASRLGVFASVLVSLLIAAPPTYGIIQGNPGSTNDAIYVYVLAGLYFLLALGIWLMWRTPAIVAFALYLIALIAIVLKTGILSGYIVTGGMASFFISGVRGTFAYKRLSDLPPPVDLRDA
jgi:hypothetical protein